MYTTSLLSRFMQSSSQIHFGVAKRILLYLRATTDYGNWYRPSATAKLIGYTDSNWAESADYRMSINLVIQFLESSRLTLAREVKKNATKNLVLGGNECVQKSLESTSKVSKSLGAHAWRRRKATLKKSVIMSDYE